jgi:hypothetical protein
MKTRKSLFMMWITALIASGVLMTNVSASTTSKSCTITCYEKTPTCYVAKDNDGCLVISDHKPVPGKKSSICTLQSCDTRTVYTP